MNVAAVIPSYNPGPILHEVVRGVAGELKPDAVIVVDDGSDDGSAAVIEREGFQVIHHPHNQGKGVALKTGFEAALTRGADWVVTIDADGQHAPSDIPRFLEAAARGDGQLIVGTRMADTSAMPPLRIFANRVTSAVISLLAGQRVEDSQSGFRMIAADVLRAVPLEMRRYDAESEILVRAAHAGFKLGSVPIQTIYGDERSAINPLVDTLRFLRLTWQLIWLRVRL